MTTPTHSSDTELFELCKDVFDLTGWDGNLKGVPARYGPAPLYTSDYLLEKLPYKITNRVNHYLELSPITPNGIKGWRAMYTFEPFTQYADTPLKALLKLTIALHEAGELK